MAGHTTHIYERAAVTYAHEPTIADIQAEGGNAAFLMVDGDPDFNPKHQTVLFQWVTCGKRQVWICLMHAAILLAHLQNMVEHVWASR